jgi:hypothetical protein
MHTPGDDDVLHATGNPAGGNPDRRQAGRAVPVDGQPGNLRHATKECHVPREITSAIQRFGEHDVIDAVRIDTGSSNRLLYDG